MTDNANPFFVKLPDRGLIHIEGDDRKSFLQGLISNDINNLDSQNAIYTCFLTPQGKFLHDFFIAEGDGFLLLDCEGGSRTTDLYKRLNMYRLRTDVKISVEEHNDVYAVFNEQPETGFKDPRHAKMGWRRFEKPSGLQQNSFDEWDKIRIRLAIPDGSRDMIIEKSTLLESNIDKLNGVSFNKGCYTGQELTARMHNRGLTKKHLHAVKLHEPMNTGDEVIINDKFIGQIRSTCDDLALALLKDDSLPSLEGSSLSILTPES